MCKLVFTKVITSILSYTSNSLCDWDSQLELVLWLLLLLVFAFLDEEMPPKAQSVFWISGLGHTKMRCPIQRKEAFKCLYCHKEFEVWDFSLVTQIKNLIRKIRTLIMEFWYVIVAILICIKFSIKGLNSLNKLRFCWTLCHF